MNSSARIFQCCSVAAEYTAEQQLIRRTNKKLLEQAEQRYTWGSQKNKIKVLVNWKKSSLVVKKHIRDWKNPLRAILLWVKIWVRKFHAEIQNFYSNFRLAKVKEKVLKSFDFRTFYGIPTVRGYKAPCFEGMVHYCMGSVLIAPGQWGQKGQTLDSACHPKWNKTLSSSFK